jgi:carbon-monoxide dehydrogenase medium subunit
LDENNKCERAKLVYLNAGDGPVDAKEAAALLAGEILNERVIASAAEQASGKEVNPFGNIHASIEYQRHLAKMLTQKALKRAVKRAEENQP